MATDAVTGSGAPNAARAGRAGARTPAPETLLAADAQALRIRRSPTLEKGAAATLEALRSHRGDELYAGRLLIALMRLGAPYGYLFGRALEDPSTRKTAFEGVQLARRGGKLTDAELHALTQTSSIYARDWVEVEHTPKDAHSSSWAEGTEVGGHSLVLVSELLGATAAARSINGTQMAANRLARLGLTVAFPATGLNAFTNVRKWAKDPNDQNANKAIGSVAYSTSVGLELAHAYLHHGRGGHTKWLHAADAKLAALKARAIPAPLLRFVPGLQGGAVLADMVWAGTVFRDPKASDRKKVAAAVSTLGALVGTLPFLPPQVRAGGTIVGTGALVLSNFL